MPAIASMLIVGAVLRYFLTFLELSALREVRLLQSTLTDKMLVQSSDGNTVRFAPCAMQGAWPAPAGLLPEIILAAMLPPDSHSVWRGPSCRESEIYYMRGEYY